MDNWTNNWPDNWTRHKAVFECDMACGPLYAAAPWAGLRPFAYDYVRNVRPKSIVELGTHYGCSAFCFLQAVKDGGLDTKVTLVDTWEGDPFTVHDYRDDVFGFFQSVLARFYSECDVKICRKRFSDVAYAFPPGSIDLLHIDGSHLYRDVCRDYYDWKNKVSGQGALFMHDITVEQDGSLLGSGQLWKKIEEEYPLTLRIPYSCGLGILFRDEKKKNDLEEILKDPGYLLRYDQENEKLKSLLRKSWFISAAATKNLTFFRRYEEDEY